jgi:hypothetical protein
MTTTQEPNSDLLDRLKAAVADKPPFRLHVNPDSAMWISISVRNTGLGDHVQVVPDPACPEQGKGWIEELSTEQWGQMQALIGELVTVTDARLGVLTGKLLTLDHREARLDLGDGDVRYLFWITVEPGAGSREAR